ncbi:MAG: enoyl-CoA hydratase/isomerase family protein [Spirochaetes bacterium]|nr:enoyl-CoA hydratase/isomerase family protein [Spirochaetota bacterium]
MSYNTIKFEISDGIAAITINRPDVLNALNADVLYDLSSVVKEVESDDSIGSVILTGEGRSFVAGADIDAMKNMTTLEALKFTELGHSIMCSFENMSKPVLAAVNGFALGGGMELTLACDFIYASTKARFGQPEVSLGIIPGFGGTQRLAYVVGINKARELVFSCDMIDADEAKRIGLVAEVFEPEELMSKVIEKAKAVMSKGPCALAAAKRVMNKGRGLSIDAALNLEREAFHGLFGTQDQKEGMKAFLEKRKPDYKNQ